MGTAGVKVLSSKDAKKAYVHCTAAALRAKNSVMKTVSTVQETLKIFLPKRNKLMMTELLRKTPLCGR